MMSIPLLYVYDYCPLYFEKKEIFIILAADTTCGCTEGVDELFQKTLGHEWMDPYVNTIDVCVYVSIADSALKNKIFSLF